MIAYWDIVQGTEEWHKIRYGKIGGSTSAGLQVKSTTLLDDILSQRLEPFSLDDDGGFENAAMRRGNELEPAARKEMSAYTGIEFLECGWLQCEDIPLFGISPDGITKDFKTECEIKCPSAKKHTTTVREGIIPLDHTNQILHSFTVNPHLKKKFFGSFRPESEVPLFVVEVTRNSALDLGTKAKPNVKTISEWVKEFKGLGMSLEAELQKEYKRIISA